MKFSIVEMNAKPCKYKLLVKCEYDCVILQAHGLHNSTDFMCFNLSWKCEFDNHDFVQKRSARRSEKVMFNIYVPHTFS